MNFRRILLVFVFVVIFLFGTGYHLFSRTPDLTVLEQKAHQAYYAGDLKAAIANYETVVRYQPGSKAALNLATLYEENGNYELARKQYERYLKGDSTNQEAQLDLAIAYYNLGEKELAREKLAKLLQTDTIKKVVQKEASYYLAKIYLYKGDHGKAHLYIDQSIAADARFALATCLKGQIYDQEGQKQKAIQYYLQSLKLDGSLVGINRRLGELYLEAQNYTKAYDRLKRALRENKDDQLAQEKIAWLEKTFPKKFESKSESPKPKELPRDVTFKKVVATQSTEKIQKIRIGLSGGEPQKVVIFRVGADFQIKDAVGKVIGQGQTGEIWKGEQLENGTFELVQYPDGKPIIFSKSVRIEPLEYTPILLHQVEFGKGYYWSGKADRQYRGELELLPKADGLTMVNIVNVEEYLYSVVPSEMPASWPEESLKVQAVAARTYTYYHLGRFAEEGFDLCDTVRCAAYNGITWENSKVRNAVNDTSGVIMTYEGKPINAVYSANSGGHTENVEDVWGFTLPYLKAVSTVKEESYSSFPLEPADLKSWLRDIPESYSFDLHFTNQSHYRWERRISVKYLQERLKIGEIQDLKIEGRGKGGSVTALRVVGNQGEIVLQSSLRSQLGGLRSNRFFLRPEYENGQIVAYVFYGGGWGHSTGMDQVAAGGMGKSGYTYDKILKHFYTGIELTDKY